MNTIVIPVSKDRPEDDILTLAETFKSVFPSGVIKITDALVIETDIPAVAAIFKQIAGTEIKPSSNGSKTKIYQCVECGEPTTKDGGHCKRCAMRLVGKKNKAAVEQFNQVPA